MKVFKRYLKQIFYYMFLNKRNIYKKVPSLEPIPEIDVTKITTCDGIFDNASNLKPVEDNNGYK